MQENFKGIRNDIGSKHIGQEFVFDATNVNNDSIVGMDSILYPERVGSRNKEYLYKEATLYTLENDANSIPVNVVKTELTLHNKIRNVSDYGKVKNVSCYTNFNANISTSNDLIFSYNLVNTSGVLNDYPTNEITNTDYGLLIERALSNMYIYYFSEHEFVAKTTSAIFPNTLPVDGQIIIIIKGLTGEIVLYVNGVNVAPTSTSFIPIPTFLVANSKIQNVALNNVHAFAMYDFSILDYTELISNGETEASIVTSLYNNNFDIGAYKFTYEFVNYRIAYDPIDGIVEYRYLDSNQIPQTQNIAIVGGQVYKNWDSFPELIYTGLQTGLCQFTTFNDKLLIVNGKDYPLWYNGATGNFYQMNAPEANQGAVGGVLNGTYQYAISFTTASGDDIFGTVSNTITTNGRLVRLTLPIPYLASIGGMKIYRTTDGGTQLKLLDTLTAPTPLFYDDNKLDSELGANIGEINNEMIKPYFVESLFDKICMSVVDKYPTQVFISEAGLEVLDPASNFIDLANQASDNTPIVGMEVDYNQLVVGTKRNIILIDPSQDVTGITFTRSNVGVLNGYSMCRVPANGNFDGGVMFVSTLGDVRLISGYKNVIPNTVNDLSTENMAQVIMGTFSGMVRSAPNIASVFYDYKYHLIVGEIMWVFDIRTESWWKYDVRTENYVSLPTCFGVSGGVLYTGQIDGWIERMYADIQYNGEDVVSSFESGTLTVNDAYKFMNNWQFWLYTSPNTELNIKMILDDDMTNAIDATFSVGEGYFSPMNFSGIFYDTGIATEDYRNFNIARTARWVKFIVTCTKGRLYFRGYNPNVEILRNKE